MKRSELQSLIREEIKKALTEISYHVPDKTNKFLLYRKSSSSPSPGHGEYLYASANTLNQLFDNWVLKMQQGGYGYKGTDLARERKRFEQEQEKYWSSGASFYKLKIRK